MTEYRLGELSARSGVSARNIRAYRERGLLEAPRREGRSAFYDDRHLAQLKMINELLRRGFTSAHIADFFAGMREGQDLADMLGLQQAIFGDQLETDVASLPIDPRGDDADQLRARGLAVDVDGEVLIDPKLAEIVEKADDPHDYVRVMLRVSDSIADSLDGVAVAVVQVLEDSVVARFGPNYVPEPDEASELREIITDYRALGSRVVADTLDAALRRHLVDEAPTYPADVVLSGRWQSTDV